MNEMERGWGIEGNRDIDFVTVEISELQIFGVCEK
jgi:hypothetical protein